MERALQLEPSNEEVKAELKSLDNSVKKYKNKTKRMMKAMFWGEGGKIEDEEESKDKPDAKKEPNSDHEQEKKEEKEEGEKSTIRKGIDAVKGLASGAYNALFGKKQ